MRRFCGIILAGGWLLVGTSAAKAQFNLGGIQLGAANSVGDPVGFGPNGVSNNKGYSVYGPQGQGYLPGLYWPTDTQGPSFYYMSVWSGLNGAPRDINSRDWSFSPPWSANYRQGQPKKTHRLSGLFHRRRSE